MFAESIKDFEDETGIDIQYSGSKEFEASITIAIDGGNPPDIVDFPQPGLLANYARRAKSIDLSTVDQSGLAEATLQPGWLDMGTMEGPDGAPIKAGIWHRCQWQEPGMVSEGRV